MMRGSQFAKKASALSALARERIRGRARAWMAGVAASLLVPAALVLAATPAPASTPAPLLVTTTSPLSATAGSAFLAKLDATGGVKPYSWSLAGGTSLPAGLVLHASTGEITGKPLGPAGTTDFVAAVTDSQSSPAQATALESITVIVTPLAVTTAALPAATAGVAYSATLTAAGGVAPYSWSVPQGSLPAGLTLHAATGVISGTPKGGGNFTFVAEVADSEAVAQTSFTSEAITVGVSGLVVTTGSTLPTATSGVPYSVKLGAAGGVAPYQWALAAGSLPAGLKLKSTGVISGTATATGLDSFAVRVTDTEAPAVSATENVSLSVVTPMVVPSALPGALADQPYDTSLQPAGGLGPYSYAITAGSLPPGLALQPDGEITGQASADGTSPFTVAVTDAENPPATVAQAESITVTGGISLASPTLSTSPNHANGPIGTVLQDTATLIGSSGATGSIEFKLYPTADCSGPPADDETATVTGDGSYATISGYTAAAAGTYEWTASYSGDASNNPAVSGCGTEQVTIGSPSPGLYWADGAGNIVTVPVAGGAPTVLASGQNGPVGVVVNGGIVYWADSGAGTIMAVPATGGAPTVLASGQDGPAYLAVDNGTVYWADNGAGTIMAVPVAGGFPTVLASGQSGPAYLAASGGVVYWIDGGTRTIMEIPESGATNVPAPLISDPGGPAYLAADGGFVYWADTNADQVMAIRASGGSPLVLTSGEPGLSAVTANGGAVYWTDLLTGDVWQVTVTGGIASPPALLASGQNGPAYLAAGGGFVSWIDRGTDTIMTVPAGGGTPFAVAGGSIGTAYLAVGP